MSKNNSHKLIRISSNSRKGMEGAPLHGVLYINFMHKCTIFYLLTTGGVLGVFFLSSLFCFPLCFVCTSKLKIIKAVFTWWKHNYSINPASWNFRFCCFPKERIHAAVVEDIVEDPLGGSMWLLFFVLRKCISNLQTQRFSSFFWPSWYSPPTKISSKLGNSS